VAGRAPVGLDIGTSCVRGVEASIARGSVRIDRFGQVALPVGAVRDGEVADVDLVAAALRRLWSEVGFKSRKVALGVSNQRVVVRQVDLPWMELAELRKSLGYQVADFLPMPVEQAILDFYPVEEYLNEAGARTLRVLIVAGAREMITNAVEAVRRAGLKPASVDLTPFALIRAVVGQEQLGMASDAEAIVDVGARVTNIAVHQGGVPKFVRILLIGGADITDSIAERLGVPVDEAERLKYSFGVPLNAVERDAHPASRAIENATASFVDEIRGSLDYYLASPGAVPIRRVVLTGGGSRLRNLAQRLAFATRLPVDTVNPFATIRLGRTGLSQEQLAYIQPLVPVPMGLAVGGLS
jgi:type IV pilus assembly protein PilM